MWLTWFCKIVIFGVYSVLGFCKIRKPKTWKPEQEVQTDPSGIRIPPKTKNKKNKTYTQKVLIFPIHSNAYLNHLPLKRSPFTLEGFNARYNTCTIWPEYRILLLYLLTLPRKTFDHHIILKPVPQWAQNWHSRLDQPDGNQTRMSCHALSATCHSQFFLDAIIVGKYTLI